MSVCDYMYTHIHIVLADSSGLNLYIVHALVFMCV